MVYNNHAKKRVRNVYFTYYYYMFFFTHIGTALLLRLFLAPWPFFFFLGGVCCFFAGLRVP